MDVEGSEFEGNELLYWSDEEYAALFALQSGRPQWLLCAIGVTQSLHTLIIKLIAFAVLKRVLVAVSTSGKLSVPVLNGCMALCGMYVLWTHNDTVVHVVLFTAVLLPLIYFAPFLNHHLGIVAISFAVTLLLLWQYALGADKYMSMRGAVMVVAMKVISLCFDVIDEATWHSVTLSTLLGYLLDPCTVLFGPWMPLKQYEESLKWKSSKEEVNSMMYAVFMIAVSLVFVVYSCCVVDLLFPGSGLWHSFGVAQSFRFSHYFISWLSAGCAIASGAPCGVVTDWISIEWPRSLVDVVVSWSIPMHRFLHKYVFAEMRRHGAAVAVFVTYAVSSLLHGINFQLSAVLLSLGFYTFVETRIRNKLSATLSSCIGVRICQNNCLHIRKKDNVITVVLNMLFRMLAMVHLVYLGMVFDDSAAESGYSASHTISVWARWLFASHAIAAFMLFVSFLL